jgi:hypothetical protein
LVKLRVESDFDAAEAACGRHDRAAYETELNQLLIEREQVAEQRLERALERRLAATWLMPNVAARCKF